MKMFFSTLGSLVLLATVSACGSGTGGVTPPGNPAIAVTCTPVKPGLLVDGACTVVVNDASGKPLSPQPDVFFASSDDNIAQIDGFGKYRTYAIGMATITVSASGQSKTTTTTIEVTAAGSSNCGTFTTSKDASGADFNGFSSNPVYDPFSSFSLNSRRITCRGDQSVAGKRVLRTVSITLGSGSLVVGQSYPADIELFEEKPNVDYRGWKNTKGTADVRLESINGKQYRFTYTNILLTPDPRYTTKGNLTMSGDITTTTF